jgi:hypothetical protein
MVGNRIYENQKVQKYSLYKITSVTTPTIKSAIAKLTTNQLKGVRRFLFGSKTTAKIIRIFPGIFVRVNKMHKLVVRIDNAVGTATIRHFLSNAPWTTIVFLRKMKD